MGHKMSLLQNLCCFVIWTVLYVGFSNQLCLDQGRTCENFCTSDLDCATDLGYNCKNSVCSGRYNLTVTEVHNKTVRLAWEDFKPIGYMFEFSVMMTSTFTTEYGTWIRKEVGQNSECVLTDLTPATQYFIRIGVWNDSSFSSYRKTSEVITVTTNDADSCSAGNRKFLVGEVINNNCEDRCECLRTGDLHCEPACQQYQEQVAGDSTSECRNVTTNDGCCTYTECSTESTLPVTVPAEETSSQYQVRIKILNISMSSVILEILFYGTPHVQHLKLCIKNTRHLNSTTESETQYKQRYYRIEGLEPGQEYAIWILFELFNNEQVKSDEKVFQTMLKKENQTVYHKRSHDQDKQNNQISSHSSVYIGVIVGIVVAMTALITVWILFMLKSRKQQKRETLSFVNFTFGVDISSVSQTDGNKDNNVNI